MVDWNNIYRGEINGTPAFLTLKKAMLELLKGYPAFQYFGIFESYFGEIPGDKVVEILERDNLIDVKREKNKPSLYRITPKGIELAISMINLDYSKETSKYNQNMHKFTIWIIWLTIITAFVGLIQIIPEISNFIKWIKSLS